MTENKVSFLDEDLGVLRKKVEAAPETDFKRKLIGGIDQEDVDKYVNSIRERLERSEEVFKNRIEEVANTNRALQDELENYKAKLGEAAEKITELNDDIRQAEDEKTALKREVQELQDNVANYKAQCESKENLYCELEDRYRLQLAELNNKEQEIKTIYDDKIDVLNKERAILEARLNEAEKQLQDSYKIIEEQKVQVQQAQEARKDDSNLESTMSGIKNGMEVLIGQFEKLDEVVKQNYELKNQLKVEKVRAEKAEKDLREFGELLSELENKINPKALLHTLKIV